jgi:hypothetical protein
MSGSKRLVEVPGLVRDWLRPYAEMFEDIIIPMVRQVPLGMIDQSLARQVRAEIAAYENRKGEIHHCFLVYYGLMLCCMYTSQECFELRKMKGKTTTLDVVNKARILICLAYQEDAYKLLPFML